MVDLEAYRQVKETVSTARVIMVDANGGGDFVSVSEAFESPPGKERHACVIYFYRWTKLSPTAATRGPFAYDIARSDTGRESSKSDAHDNPRGFTV